MPLDYTNYVSKLTVKPCPNMPQPPDAGVTNPAKWTEYAADLTTYRDTFIDHVKSLKAWALDQATLLEAFRADLLTAYSLTDNPKADILYQLAAAKNKTSLEDIEATTAKLSPLLAQDP